MPEQARYTVKAPNGQTYRFNARAGLNRRQAESALERAMPAAFQQRYTVRADDGQTYRFNAREGMSQSEARRALHRAAPETDRDRNSLGAGWALARNALTTGLPYALDRQFGTLTPEEERRYLASQRAAAQLAEERLPGGAPSIGDMTSGRSDFFGGLLENLGQSAPQAGATIAGGLAGAAIGTAVAPGPGTLAGGIGGVLGGVGASTPFFVGSNVARATEGGQTVLTSDAAGRALAVAPLQAGADVLAAKFIPGLGRVFGGPATSTAISRLARPGLARGAVRVGQGAVAGGAAEAGQQFGERYAAGLPLGDREAMGEYGESAALGAIMDASIGVAGAPFSGRRDGSAPPANAPPAAGDTDDVAVEIAARVKALAPNQRAVFEVEYAKYVEELPSGELAAETALQAAERVPPVAADTAQGTEDVTSDGRPDGEGVPSSDARSELYGTAAGPEGTAAGDVGGAGSPASVDVQGQSDVDGSLTPPKKRRGKAAAAPAPEVAAPVDQTPIAPMVELDPVSQLVRDGVFDNMPDTFTEQQQAVAMKAAQDVITKTPLDSATAAKLSEEDKQAMIYGMRTAGALLDGLRKENPQKTAAPARRVAPAPMPIPPAAVEAAAVAQAKAQARRGAAVDNNAPTPVPETAPEVAPEVAPPPPAKPHSPQSVARRKSPKQRTSTRLTPQL